MLVGVGLGQATVFVAGFVLLTGAGACTILEQEVVESFRDCEDCPEMIAVPPGSYMMGSRERKTERRGSERPQHRVTLDYEFAVGVYEVTLDEWMHA